MGTSTPEVSVLLPAAGPAPWLAQSMQSILAQRDADFELLLVNDGLASAQAALAEDWFHDPRVRLLTTPPGQQGLVPALNLGLASARGRFIARMDADDVAHPDRLARQAQHLRETPDLGLVSCRVQYVSDGEPGAGYAGHVDWCNRLLSREQIANYRFVESPCPHPSVMFRAEIVERFGGYRAGPFPEDYELWLRWLEQGVAMEKVDAQLLIWRDSSERLSRTDVRYATDAFYSVKAEYLARWSEAHNPFHPRVTVWGAGRVTRQRLLPLTARGLCMEAFVDIDPKKVGRRIGDVPVLSPGQLPPPGQCFVLSFVAARGARELIEDELCSRGYRLGRDYLPAA